MGKGVLLLVTAWFISGCGASLQAKDCATVDWQAKGYEDSMNGKTKETFEKYKETCSANPPNTSQYVAGYKKASSEYCTAANGEDRGIKGGKYHLSCSQNTEYYAAYTKALKKYSEEKERKQLEGLTRRGGDVTDSIGVSGGGPGM